MSSKNKKYQIYEKLHCKFWDEKHRLRSTIIRSNDSFPIITNIFTSFFYSSSSLFFLSHHLLFLKIPLPIFLFHFLLLSILFLSTFNSLSSSMIVGAVRSVGAPDCPRASSAIVWRSERELGLGKWSEPREESRSGVEPALPRSVSLRERIRRGMLRLEKFRRLLSDIYMCSDS